MNKTIRLIILASAMAMNYTPLFGDVLITNDGMILNGKVISKTKDETVFSNYHGTFKIKNEIIQKIHVTEKFEEDVKLLEDMGKKINKSDIKRNFQSGAIKKEKVLEKVSRQSVPETEKNAFHMDCQISSFYLFNTGSLDNVLPYSFGGSLSSDLHLWNYLFNSNSLLIPELRIEASYLYAEKNSKRIDGFGLTLGPVWFYPVTIRNYKFHAHLASLFGSGNYNVENTDTQTRRFSFNINIIAGVAFPIGQIELVPAFRFGYIYDSEAPLYSFGFNFGLGYRIF